MSFVVTQAESPAAAVHAGRVSSAMSAPFGPAWFVPAYTAAQFAVNKRVQRGRCTRVAVFHQVATAVPVNSATANADVTG